MTFAQRPRLRDRLARIPPGSIDSHTHAIDPDLLDIAASCPGIYPIVERIGRDRARILMDGRTYREIDDRCWSVSARLRDMDAEGVAAQLLSPIPVTLCLGEPAAGADLLARTQNDFLAQMVAAAPDRLFALGAVPLQDVELAVTELRRVVEELGFVGVEIGTRVGEVELADPSLVPFFQVAAELGATVFVHPVDRTLDPRLALLKIGFGLGMPAETAVAAAGLLVSDLLDLAPGLRIVLAHGAGTLPSALPRVAFGQRIVGGETDPARSAMVRARSLWCDSLTYDVDGLRLSMQRVGAEHVVLGTDYPFAAREEPAGAVLTAAAGHIDAATLRAIARDNALALLSETKGN